MNITCFVYRVPVISQNVPPCGLSVVHNLSTLPFDLVFVRQTSMHSTLSSSVILDKRASTLKLENPCPDGPSLLPRVRAIAKQTYRLHMAHIRKLLNQPSADDVCIPRRMAQRPTLSEEGRENMSLCGQGAAICACTPILSLTLFGVAMEEKPSSGGIKHIFAFTRADTYERANLRNTSYELPTDMFFSHRGSRLTFGRQLL